MPNSVETGPNFTVGDLVTWSWDRDPLTRALISIVGDGPFRILETKNISPTIQMIYPSRETNCGLNVWRAKDNSWIPYDLIEDKGNDCSGPSPLNGGYFRKI